MIGIDVSCNVNDIGGQKKIIEKYHREEEQKSEEKKENLRCRKKNQKTKNTRKHRIKKRDVLGVQLCFRRFPIDGFSGKWWSK